MIGAKRKLLCAKLSHWKQITLHCNFVYYYSIFSLLMAMQMLCVYPYSVAYEPCYHLEDLVVCGICTGSLNTLLQMEHYNNNVKASSEERLSINILIANQCRVYQFFIILNKITYSTCASSILSTRIDSNWASTYPLTCFEFQPHS